MILKSVKSRVMRLGRSSSWMLFLSLGLLCFQNIAQSQETPKQNNNRNEIALEHSNDFDIIGGNDEGLTFQNGIYYNNKSLDSETLRPRYFSVELSNQFFTQKQTLEPDITRPIVLDPYLRDGEGRIYLDYFERIELKVRRQIFEDTQENRSWINEVQVQYDHNNKSSTGAELQDNFHDLVGFDASPNTQRVYNYSQNNVDLNRVGAQLKCLREWKEFYSSHITHKTQIGAQFSTFDIEDVCIVANSEIQFHTQTDTVFDRDRPTFCVFAGVNCNQFFDIHETDSACYAGIQSSLELHNNKKLFLRCEWIQPLSHNENINQNFNDLDPIIKMSMGITW